MGTETEYVKVDTPEPPAKQQYLIYNIKMKKSIAALALLALSCTAKAQQTDVQHNGWFNHFDVAFTVGTSGLGFDLATPMSEWARLRMGGVFRPLYRYDASFNMEISEGLSNAEQNDRFEKLSTTLQALTGKTPNRTVDMQGDLKMNNFKFLVDIFPIKNCRKFHFTMGFYYGNDVIVDVRNTPESVRNLEAINAYNSMYKKALAKENLIDLGSLGIEDAGGATFESANRRLRYWGARANGPVEKGYNEGDVLSDWNEAFGVDPTDNRYYAEYGMSLPIGTMKHDLIAEEDIYYDYTEVLDNPYYAVKNGEDVLVSVRTDANGREIRKGSLRYKKGEVVRRAGETLRFVPDEDNSITAAARVNKFKPYVGVGFDTPITKDKRTSIAIDAGVMFWGGKPSVDISTPVGVDAEGNKVYCTVNLVNDVSDLPSNVARYVNSVKKYSVFPEISLRISQRLW